MSFQPHGDQPLVTIGIPTYNRADRYLREALESALAQTYAPLEIIVSDNGSTDGTPAYVQGISDTRLHYHRHEPILSPNGNFNFCLDTAKGEYFLLLHDDDRIDPDFIETCIGALKDHPGVGVIRTGTRLIDADSQVLRDTPMAANGKNAAELFHNWFAKKTSFYFCSTLYHTQTLRAVGGLHSKHNVLEDCTAILDVAAKTGQIEISEVKASFREHANYAQYGRKLKLWVEDFLWLLERVQERLPEADAGLLEAGRAFFASLSYRRARTITSRWRRWLAFFYVWRQMGLYYPPPALSRHLKKPKRL